MNRWSVGRGLAVVSFVALLAGCSGAEWQRVQVTPGYQPPKEVKIAVVTQATGPNMDDAIIELREALADEFAAQGVKATFVEKAADVPSAELSVVEWDRGVRALRWLGFGGEGHIVIIVKSGAAAGQPGLDGQSRGFVRSGWFGGSSYNAATYAGHQIARTIATGKP
jgi:hypothetical protein